MDAPFPPAMMPCIENFFNNIHPTLTPRVNAVYQEVFDTDLFFPLQRQKELAHMLAIANKYSPTTIYEIGADKGAGLYHWCMSCPTVKHIIACEIRGLPYKELFESAFPHIQFTWIDGSSYSRINVAYVLSRLRVMEHKTIDVLFIDGDKGNFLTDFNAYHPLMSQPGVVFMHDINDGAVQGNSSPYSAFMKVKETFRTEAYINQEDTKEALKRERQGLPSRGSHEGWLRYWKGKSCGVGVIYLD